MSLLEDRPEGLLTVRWVREDRITVGADERLRSFLLAPDELNDWSPRSADEIDEAAIAAILAMRPQLVVLGTGPRQRFLPPQLQILLYQRGVGVEVMDNAAAARTYNLLAMEGRRVVAGFILPGYGIRD